MNRHSLVCIAMCIEEPNAPASKGTSAESLFLGFQGSSQFNVRGKRIWHRWKGRGFTQHTHTHTHTHTLLAKQNSTRIRKSEHCNTRNRSRIRLAGMRKSRTWADMFTCATLAGYLFGWCKCLIFAMSSYRHCVERCESETNKLTDYQAN